MLLQILITQANKLIALEEHYKVVLKEETGSLVVVVVEEVGTQLVIILLVNCVANMDTQL